MPAIVSNFLAKSLERHLFKTDIKRFILVTPDQNKCLHHAMLIKALSINMLMLPSNGKGG